VLEGLVNIRGQLQLCVSLHGLLGLEGKPTLMPSAGADAALTAARLLVIERSGEQGTERWVFGVDEVAGVHRAIKSALRAVPSTVSQSGTRHCQALFDWQGRAVGLLDEARVFDGLCGAVGG
jgi:chemotaxis-related protein WspD